jgi:hypothetical protein
VLVRGGCDDLRASSAPALRFVAASLLRLLLGLRGGDLLPLCLDLRPLLPDLLPLLLGLRPLLPDLFLFVRLTPSQGEIDPLLHDLC